MWNKYYSLADRQGLPAFMFGDETRRLFLIEKQEDVDKAPRRIKHAHDPEKVRDRIIEICRRKGLKLPAEWRGENIAPASLAECSLLIGKARTEMKQQRTAAQIADEAREQLDQQRESGSYERGWSSEKAEAAAIAELDAQEERRALAIAAKAAVKTTEDILREEIEQDGATQAKRFAEQLNAKTPRVRSHVSDDPETISVIDQTLSWIAKMKRKGIRN